MISYPVQHVNGIAIACHYMCLYDIPSMVLQRMHQAIMYHII
jgi:hypothetical protein